MFKRRISLHPQALGLTPWLKVCPDMWELEDGDYAIIGKDITSEALDSLPVSASVGVGEKVVRIPRALLASAKKNIPEK